MKCIVALMIAALVMANETGLGRMNPGLGIAICAVMMWGVFRLIDNIHENEEASDEELYDV